MYLLIGERTRTRAHTRRNSGAVFHLRIFGFSASEIFCCFLMTYRHLLSEHLASTGKQSDPTLRLVMIPLSRVIPRGSKNEVVRKSWTLDQLARTATPRASES